MNYFKGTIFLIIAMAYLGACSPKPKPIVYGTDGCHFCKMTIVDRQHAAQLVTKKGKVFTFDAIECMVNYSNEIDTSKIALYLSNYYTNPEELTDATKATFLISEAIPSPMGAFLTAFDSREEAEKVQSELDGELFSWSELLNHLDSKDYVHDRR